MSELDLSQMGMQFTTSYAIHPKINLKARMQEYGWTAADFAKPAVKNSYNGSLNPLAQHQRPLTIEQVVQSRVVVDPLTLYMCASISDGAAAAVVCAADIAARFTSKTPVRIASCVLKSGVYRLPDDERPDTAATTAQAAYEQAGIGPEDLEAIELHDAMAPAELMLYERLGLCAPGEGPRLIDENITTLRGKRAGQSERRPVLARPSGRRDRPPADRRAGLADARRSGPPPDREAAARHHGAEPGRPAARARTPRSTA